jgi:hypothetical protein
MHGIKKVSCGFKLTSSTELSPSQEAVSCAATQKFPDILWNLNVHYRVHNSPPLVSIRGQISPVSKIHFNIVTCVIDCRGGLDW